MVKRTPNKKDPRIGKARMSRERGLIKPRRPAVGAASAPGGVRLENVRVVLSHPEFGGNVGQVARAMLNMGLTRLDLVNPTRRYRSPESRQMAVGAWEVIKNARRFESLEDALAGSVFSIAFTAGTRRATVPVEPFENRLDELAALSHKGEVALVFGNEVRGLTNEEISKCNVACKLQVNENFTSLNLAQAALIAAFQVFSHRRAPGAPVHFGEPARHEQIEGFFDQMYRLLYRTAFLPKAAPDKFFRGLRHLFQKIPLEDREVRILRGILTNFEWNLDNPGRAKPWPPPAGEQALLRAAGWRPAEERKKEEGE